MNHLPPAKRFFAASLLALSAQVTVVSGRAEDFRGHWHLTFYGKCRLTPANREACKTLQAPAYFAVIGVNGATIVVKGVGDYFSDSRGQYRVRFHTSIMERVSFGHTSFHCDNTTVFLQTYNGTCTETGTGHGHIALGKTGMPDFWQDDTAGHWTGDPPARFSESSTIDTLNPACVGVLDTKHLMRLLGVRWVPPGITARLTLSRHR